MRTTTTAPIITVDALIDTVLTEAAEPTKAQRAVLAAEAILTADGADEALASATTTAAAALMSAATVVHQALQAGVSLQAIVAARPGISKKTAQRIGFVGFCLAQAPTAVAPEGAISLAHALRHAAVKAERMGLGIAAQRTLVTGSPDPLGDLYKAIDNVGKETVVVVAPTGSTGGETGGEVPPPVFSSTEDTAAAHILVEQATAAVVLLAKLLKSDGGVRAADRPAVDGLLAAIKSMGEAGIALALVTDAA